MVAAAKISACTFLFFAAMMPYAMAKDDSTVALWSCVGMTSTWLLARAFGREVT